MKYLIALLILTGFICGAVEARHYYAKGYYRANGTYVNGHLKTTPDAYKWNNINYE